MNMKLHFKKFQDESILSVDIAFVLDSKSLSDILNKKIDISDSNSSENGADSHAETTSTSNSDTA